MKSGPVRLWIESSTRTDWPILFAARHGFKDMYGHILGRTCVTGESRTRDVPADAAVSVDTGKAAAGRSWRLSRTVTELLELPLMQELVPKWDCYGASCTIVCIKSSALC